MSYPLLLRLLLLFLILVLLLLTTLFLLLLLPLLLLLLLLLLLVLLLDFSPSVLVLVAHETRFHAVHAGCEPAWESCPKAPSRVPRAVAVALFSKLC